MEEPIAAASAATQSTPRPEASSMARFASRDISLAEFSSRLKSNFALNALDTSALSALVLIFANFSSDVAGGPTFFLAEASSSASSATSGVGGAASSAVGVA